MSVIQRQAGRSARLAVSCIAWMLSLGAIAAAGAAPIVRYELLKDLDVSTGSQGSEPVDFVEWNGRAYFAATTPATGIELFRTDGTPGGTRLFHDFAAGPASSDVRPLGAVNGRLIVEANDGVVGRQLWAIADDGTPPVRLSSVPIGNQRFYRFAATGGKLLLAADWQGPLWVTDGTPAGTQSLAAALANGRVYPGSACVLGDVVVFAGRNASSENVLMRTDATVAGTAVLARLADRIDASGLRSVSLNGQCQILVGVDAFSGGGWTLWTSQGTSAATAPVATDASATPLGLMVAGGVLHIAQAKDGRYQLLRNVPGTASFNVTLDMPTSGGYSRPVVAGGRIGFVLEYDEPGVGRRRGLFAGDGTPGGMQRIYPTQAGQAGVPYAEPIAVNGAFVFQTYDDGLRIDAATGAASTAPSYRLFDLQTSVALDNLRIGPGVGPNGVEPWSSDGSSGGTHLLADLWPTTANGLGALDSVGTRLESASNGDLLFFTTPGAFDSNRYALWRTDGSTAGTRKLPPALLEFNSVRSPLPLGDGVVFFDSDGPGPRSRVVRASPALDAVEPLSTNPYASSLMSTGSGVIFLGYAATGTDLYAGAGGAPASVIWSAFDDIDTRPIGQVGGAAIFHGGSGRDIWRSDGTAPGTFMIAEADWLHVTPWQPPQSRQFLGKLYFVNCRAPTACALTATDGTVAGTTVVRDLPPASASWMNKLTSFAVVGDRLLFVLEAATTQWWVSDGTTAGTDVLTTLPAWTTSAMAVVGGRAHLTFDCPSACKSRYAVSDGTAAGTRFVDMPPGIEPVPGVMVALGSSALFSCSLAQVGAELCLANADAGEVRLLGDLFPGPEGSNARVLGVTTNAVYLKLDDGAHGYEPWVVRELSDRIFGSGFEPGSAKR